MPRPNRELEREVISRAAGACEYCRFPEPLAELTFHTDHIIAEKHKGPTTLSNLAWACFSCNMHKGPNVAGVDPISGNIVRLYHPRNDAWNEHFHWQGAWLHGITPIGRTTIAVLEINATLAILIREALLAEGWQP